MNYPYLPNNNPSFKFASNTEPDAEIVMETDAKGNQFYYALESTGKRLVASEIMGDANASN